MTLIKSSFWTGLSVFTKIIATFITSKIIALYMGPVGLALIEQFQNFIQIVRTFSGNLIQQGIVKYIAEYKNDENKKARILSSAAVFYVIISIIFGVILFYFSTSISTYILHTSHFHKVIKLLAVSLILYSLNCLLYSLLNGEFEIKDYAACNIINTILILLVTIYLVKNYDLTGALAALTLNQSITFFFTLYLVTRCRWFKFSVFFKGIDFNSFYQLITFAVITVVVTITIPVSQMIIRDFVIHTLSWADAGYWQGMIKLSNNYAILVDAILGIYYLPKLSGIKSISELKNEIIKSYSFLLPLIILAAIIIFILKKYLVIILYSKEFLPMLFLFKYQLIGDFARVGAWLLLYVMMSKKMVKELIITEIFFLIVYVSSTIMGVKYLGLIGTAIGFAISYILYWGLMLFFTYRYMCITDRNVTRQATVEYSDSLA